MPFRIRNEPVVIITFFELSVSIYIFSFRKRNFRYEFCFVVFFHCFSTDVSMNFSKESDRIEQDTISEFDRMNNLSPFEERNIEFP